MATYVNLDTIQRAVTGSVVPASWLDQVNDNCNALYGDSAWTTVSSFANSWAVFASSVSRYRKVGNVVFMQGKIAGGTPGATTAFTLPSGYYPSTTQTFAVMASGSVLGRLDVLSTGVVQVVAGSSTWTSIDVSFCVL